MVIDPADLLPITPSEFKVGGWFYLLLEDGTYSLGKMPESESKHWIMKYYWGQFIINNCREKKLFVRREKPWHTFSGLPPDDELRTYIFTDNGISHSDKPTRQQNKDSGKVGRARRNTQRKGGNNSGQLHTE